MIPGTERPLGLTVTGEEDRPAILFLHGFIGSKSEWTRITDALGRGFRCVALDLPGHGTSLDLPDAAYTVEGAAKATAGLLDALGIERPIVAGYSMGGRLALYLALRYPGRCAGLFLESASPGLGDEEERAARRKADEERALRLESDDFEAFLRDWYRQPLFASLTRDEALLRRTIEERRGNDPAELARSLRGMGTGSQPSLWEDLPELRVPTLAVTGELDDKFVCVSRFMEDVSPQVRTISVTGVGHNVHDEAPEEYLALLRGFVKPIP